MTVQLSGCLRILGKQSAARPTSYTVGQRGRWVPVEFYITTSSVPQRMSGLRVLAQNGMHARADLPRSLDLLLSQSAWPCAQYAFV